MSKVNGHLVRRASQPLPDTQRLPAAVDNLSEQNLRVKPLSGVAPCTGCGFRLVWGPQAA